MHRPAVGHLLSGWSGRGWSGTLPTTNRTVCVCYWNHMLLRIASVDGLGPWRMPPNRQRSSRRRMANGDGRSKSTTDPDHRRANSQASYLGHRLLDLYGCLRLPCNPNETNRCCFFPGGRRMFSRRNLFELAGKSLDMERLLFSPLLCILEFTGLHRAGRCILVCPVYVDSLANHALAPDGSHQRGRHSGDGCPGRSDGSAAQPSRKRPALVGDFSGPLTRKLSLNRLSCQATPGRCGL